MQVGDKVRVKPSSSKNSGEIGTITYLSPGGVATIQSPSSSRKFSVHEDFLEEYDWDEE
jgi:hypothetical protein